MIYHNPLDVLSHIPIPYSCLFKFYNTWVVKSLPFYSAGTTTKSMKTALINELLTQLRVYSDAGSSVVGCSDLNYLNCSQ